MPANKKPTESVADYRYRVNSYMREYRKKNIEKIREYNRLYMSNWRKRQI